MPVRAHGRYNNTRPKNARPHMNRTHYNVLDDQDMPAGGIGGRRQGQSGAGGNQKSGGDQSLHHNLPLV
jgi:hypothetical protein